MMNIWIVQTGGITAPMMSIKLLLDIKNKDMAREIIN